MNSAKITWTLEAKMRRQEGKKWVAKIIGANKDSDRLQTFEYQFLNPASTEWGKHGIRKAIFEIVECGFYKDSDEDFFKVYRDEEGLQYQLCTWQEVAERLALVNPLEVEEVE